MVYYLHGLDPGRPSGPPRAPSETLEPSPQPSGAGEEGSRPSSSLVDLILGGYSYGSMIASHLPKADVVVKLFADAAEGSSMAAIRTRAQHFAADWNTTFQARLQLQSSRPGSPDSAGTPSPVALGYGSDSSAKDSRGDAFDSIMRRVDRSKRRLSARLSRSEPQTARVQDNTNAAGTTNGDARQIPPPRISYLLVSPILPPITLFLTMFSRMSLSTEVGSGTSVQGAHVPSPKPEEQLCAHPTLVIYGNRDTFTPEKKIQKWSDELARAPGTKFQYREIDGAGHFWHEAGAETQMRAALREWLSHTQQVASSQTP
ncbi:hypothetical protein VTN02DRAFT_5299 [Thermoascus thermophilus]